MPFFVRSTSPDSVVLGCASDEGAVASPILSNKSCDTFRPNEVVTGEPFIDRARSVDVELLDPRLDSFLPASSSAPPK